MRASQSSLILSLALTIGLSGCGRDDDSAQNQMGRTEASNAKVISARADRPKDKTAKVENISVDRPLMAPASFQGRWIGTKDQCDDTAAEQELEITPRELIFHESVGTITQVTKQAGGKVAIDAAFTGEGQSWTRRLETRLSADGQTLTIANDGQMVNRKRCGDAPA